MAADSGSRKKLTFVRVDEDFWRKLCSVKLNKLGLDDSPIPITGFIAPCLHREALMPLTLNYESLPSNQEGWFCGNRNKCPVPGILYNANTLEGFNEIYRKSLLKAEAKKIWDDINSGRVEEDGSLLLRFVVVSFAELKDWKINYWLALPTLQLDPPATMASLRPALQCLDPGQAESLRAAFIEWRNSGLTTCVPFFLVCIASDSRVSIRKLADWEACQRSCDKVLFGFYDPCHFPDAPGWPLQNYVAYICVRWRVEKIRFFCYRELGGFVDLQSSLIGEVSVSVSRGWSSPDHVPNAVGWQRFKGKMTQCVSLARSLDPKRLAESAAELNLKLMRWRQFSSLNLEILSGTKCLLLGAGTLGCQVARMLMAWGFREITMVDCGRVAMSNPVRQSLYTFDDSIDGGEFKAVAAARSLERIFPAVKAESVVMAIPMPGHPVPIGEKQNALNDCEKLKKLIEDHHAIFLLTDTRESRWLPSLLCASANKITITAGLGFESFVVMRHGAGPLSLSEDSKATDMNNLSAELGDLSLSDRTGKQRLGCYFCNDVVAPMDSTANRTLDQQCTVTRPGLAPIASALAVELLVGILHHPRGILADAEFENSTNDTTSGNPLGILPHQIRGSLFQFSQMTLVGHASSSCTACSSTVVSEYRERDTGFILDTINNPMYLEDLTGLTELKNSSSSFDLDWVDEVVDDTDDFLEI